MRAEGRHLLALADEVDVTASGIYPTWRVRFGSTACVVVLSGIGMVRAAAATEHLISRWAPEAVMNFGCTGAHEEEIGLGDVIIGTRCVPHFSLQILPNGRERYVGFITEEGDDLAHVEDTDSVATAPALVERAIAAAPATGIEPWPGYSHAPNLHVGAVASADVWTQQLDRLEAIHDRHETLCEDMEAAAIGKIASLHRVPFLTVKDISNNEFLKSTNLEDFTEFPVEEVGKRAAAVIGTVLRDYALPFDEAISRGRRAVER